MHPKSIKNDAKIRSNPSKSTNMLPKCPSKAIPKTNRCHGVRVTKFLGAFVCHLGDFGCYFGPSWAPRGSQNQAFWHQVANKSTKMRSRRGSQKNNKKHGYLMRKYKVLGMLNHGISSILLRNYSVGAVFIFCEERREKS